jgi:hypothetical protein
MLLLALWSCAWRVAITLSFATSCPISAALVEVRVLFRSLSAVADRDKFAKASAVLV